MHPIIRKLPEPVKDPISYGAWRVRSALSADRRIDDVSAKRSLFAEKTGLEIGGPSKVLTRLLPIYHWAARIDNCNFSDQTIWENMIDAGETFQFNRRRAPGTQYILEATNLSGIPDEHYDFVVSCHALEHVANPILALKEWIRVMKSGGTLALILPHKEGTFDHRRPVTPLSHLIDDFENRVSEDDQTHVEEILRLHDYSRDHGTPSEAEMRLRLAAMAETRCVHHHVFDTPSAISLVDHVGLEIAHAQACLPHEIVIIARKSNGRFDNECVEFKSPFGSDLAS
ncbi:MAG: class I SAM-dependent methyltransferase [Pseudomonadota bacterium]